MAFLTAEADVAAAIDGMVADIVARFRPREIILFGSRGRGDHEELSDVDLLVILPDEDYNGISTSIEVQRVLGVRGLGVDLIVAPDSIMRRKEGIWGTLFNAARREGRVLYAG